MCVAKDNSSGSEIVEDHRCCFKIYIGTCRKMSGIFSFMDGYGDFMETHMDPRTKDWFLSGKLGHLIVILATYVYFCTKAGPKFMKDKKPYDLKRTIQIYNLFQVFASLYMVHEGYYGGWGTNYSYACQPVIPGEKGMRMAKGVWFYFFCKLTELLDTVFFVLRKKYNQVTYLHVYHHTLMPICAWIGLTFLPGGHATMLGWINSFIHVIMYTYYFLSSLGPGIQEYLWWKKYLTAMQMGKDFNEEEYLERRKTLMEEASKNSKKPAEQKQNRTVVNQEEKETKDKSQETKKNLEKNIERRNSKREKISNKSSQNKAN
ncbi:hypothetical protein JTB14_010007 [Gonioctena quinquepunctata]|nr:hypothetical protein JTB14_010007 [Gonioctena quinquepunctata]